MLRFLAEDVGKHLDAVLDTILRGLRTDARIDYTWRSINGFPSGPILTSCVGR